MKRKGIKCISILLLAACLLMGLAACGDDSAAQQTPPSGQTAQPTQGPEPSEAPGGGVLVVYFSATGSTEAVANTIAEVTNGDLFAIEPVEPYTEDDLNWTDANSRVSREHNDPALQRVELTAVSVDNWDSYDTVFLGYPIWWGNAAWPVNDFVKSNNFSGKTVIPFCTSASSGLGQSGELLKEMAGTGRWLEGYRFSSGSGQTDVEQWVDTLDLPALP